MCTRRKAQSTQSFVLNAPADLVNVAKPKPPKEAHQDLNPEAQLLEHDAPVRAYQLCLHLLQAQTRSYLSAFMGILFSR